MLYRAVGINKGLLAAATLMAVFLLGTPQNARADLEIGLSLDATSTVTVVATAASFTSATFTGYFGPSGAFTTPQSDSIFKITVQSGSSDNGATLSDLLASTTAVTNVSGQTINGVTVAPAGTHTLHLFTTQTGYNLPTGTPLNMESGLGGSVNSGSVTLNGIYQSWASNGTLTTTVFDRSGDTTGSQNATQSGSTFQTGSAVGLFDRASPSSFYTLTSEANLQLPSGSTVNYSAHVNVTAVPEPATAAMVLSGLPVLGLIWARRRRQQV